MRKKKKKAVVRVIFIYLLLTTGIWMFLMSYSNSYNRLSTEKISPASLNLNEETAEMKILEHTFTMDITKILPESKLYYILYLLAPDELRFMSVLISLTNRI